MGKYTNKTKSNNLMMKKTIATLLAIGLALSTVACGNNAAKEESIKASIEESIQESLEASISDSVEESIQTSIEESILASIEESQSIEAENTLKATITKLDGEVVEMSAQELMDAFDANEAGFYKKYLGAKITFIGTLSTVKTKVYAPVEENRNCSEMNKVVFEEGWSVVLSPEDTSIDLADLNKGDKYTVTSSIIGSPNTEYMQKLCEGSRVVWLIGDGMYHDTKIDYGTITTFIPLE